MKSHWLDEHVAALKCQDKITMNRVRALQTIPKKLKNETHVNDHLPPTAPRERKGADSAMCVH